MPLARAKAEEASFPTLVLLGKECFRMRRTHAKGGSNSTAEGGAWGCLSDFSGVGGIVDNVICKLYRVTKQIGWSSRSYSRLSLLPIAFWVMLDHCIIVGVLLDVARRLSRAFLVPLGRKNSHSETRADLFVSFLFITSHNV